MDVTIQENLRSNRESEPREAIGGVILLETFANGFHRVRLGLREQLKENKEGKGEDAVEPKHPAARK